MNFRKRKVACTHTLTNETFCFESISEAASTLYLDNSHIVKCCAGITKQHKGYTFRYLLESEDLCWEPAIKSWTEEEDSALKKYYPTQNLQELMIHVSNKNLADVVSRAKTLGLLRKNISRKNRSELDLVHHVIEDKVKGANL